MNEDGTAPYTFVLRVTDRPGAMELIAATFAHRGVSLSSTLGSGGEYDPDGHATVVVHFHATPTRREGLKATLARLSRVISLVEHGEGDPAVRQAVLLRLAPGAPAPAYSATDDGVVQTVGADPATGETTYALLGPSAATDALLDAARADGTLRSVTRAVLAL